MQFQNRLRSSKLEQNVWKFSALTTMEKLRKFIKGTANENTEAEITNRTCQSPFSTQYAGEGQRGRSVKMYESINVR